MFFKSAKRNYFATLGFDVRLYIIRKLHFSFDVKLSFFLSLVAGGVNANVLI